LRIWKKNYIKSKLQSFRENIFPVDCSVVDGKSLENLCRLINKEKIEACLGYASWFDLLVKYIENNNYTLKSLKTIISGSEMLNPVTRVKLKELIGCDIVSRYSNEEQGILGQEHVFDEKIYLNHASYYFELLKLDSDEKQQHGKIGRIVVTDLFNYAFPLIRYDTGDTGILTEGNIESSGYPILNKLYGRRINLIYDVHRTPILPQTLFAILAYYPKISQWQFIQKNINNYVLKINGANGDYLNQCLLELKSILGAEAIITIEFVDNIPVLASGKRKAVICEMHQ
jgi:phenylacetate-CoA ligase